ncbi:MAG TPA: carboxypeptidase-like regulatory domain-containing protein [Bacteroidia bacterium]|jgi:hypothetical protein|nr:carboxypeptidase-like regulatory domain-containing protein [Bacteroidia bacterium]
MHRSLLSIFLFLNAFNSIAQNKFTISGYVRDSISGEELIGSIIHVKELSGAGASANAYGYYSLTIPEGNHTLIIQALGYKPKQIIIELKQSTKLDVKLSQNINQLNEVSVTAEKKNENITNTQMGVIKLDMKTIEKVPVIFGEKDVMKTLQLTPGVKSAGEGNSGFYVRGGSTDQNLILLDEATVYNASHLLGFFSVFNSDAIKDVTLYKGNQPSQFGGRLSSVLDIKMKDGNDKKFGVEGGIGIIASRLKIDGPIKKEKGSFMISARRTYADLLGNLVLLFEKSLPLLWYKNGSLVQSGSSNTYVASGSANTNYTVTVTMYTSGCAAKPTQQATYHVGNGPNCNAPPPRLANAETDHNHIDASTSVISLIPNPATNQVTVHYDITEDQSAELVIINMYGKTIGKYKLNAKEKQIDVDCTPMAAGAYSTTLMIGGQVKDFKKLIITK